MAFAGFSVKFPDVDAYLELTFKLLDQELKDAIRALEAGTYQNTYSLLPVRAEGNNAEILGVQLRVKNYGVDPSADENDFVIVPDKGKGGGRLCAAGFAKGCL